MNMEYYIIVGEERTGPYDVAMLVRKIRNGSLHEFMPVQQKDGVVLPAVEWPSLAEFFNAEIAVAELGGAPARIARSSLARLLKKGLRFLQDNPATTIFSGLVVLTIILMTSLIHFLLPEQLRGLGYVASFIVTYFLLGCYQFTVLRTTRGQPVDAVYFKRKIGPVWAQLLVASVFISAVAIIGLVLLISAQSPVVAIFGLLLFAAPGLFLLSIHAFAPLLIIDQGYEFWDAMQHSRNVMLKSGFETIGTVFALFVINFIAGLVAILPLTITLPITMSALSELYDDGSFN